MPRVKKLDLGMTALDELFMDDKERAENKLPKIFDIPLSEIDDFPGHPYRVLDDEDMQNVMESIKDRGVITPASEIQRLSWQEKSKAARLALISVYIIHSHLVSQFSETFIILRLINCVTLTEQIQCFLLL